MKLDHKWHLFALFGIMVFVNSPSRALNCTFILASPGFIEFPSSGGPGFVNVSVGPDSGCTYFVSPSGAAIQSVGFPGLGGFSFTANANPGPSNLNGTLTISTGQASSNVSVTVDPPSAVGLGSLTSAVNPVASTTDVDYVGGDAHIHRLWYNGSWHKTDLSALTGAPNAANGSALASIADSITNTFDTYYLGTDQHVHQIWLSGSTWHTADVTSAAGAPNAATGSALASIPDTVANTVDVYYLGSDLHVHQLWLSSGTWHTTDVTAATGAPNAVSGSALVSLADSLTNTADVYYLGSDQHVHQLWWNGIWHTLDLTASAGAPNAASGSALASIRDTLANTVDVYYLGTDQHVYQLWLSSGIWHATDVTSAAGAPSAVSGSALASIADSITNTTDVCYQASDQHVHQLWWNGIWHTLDLTVAAGAPNAVSGSPLTSIPDTIANTVDVYYVGSDQHVHQLFLSGGVWHTADLTTVTGP